MKRVLLLGASGSIGSSSLDILKKHPDSFQLVGVSCHSNQLELESIQRDFPGVRTALSGLSQGELPFDYTGKTAVRDLIRNTPCDLVINGIGGSPGLEPSYWSLMEGRDLALANKETIVMAGPQIMQLAEEKNCRLLPVDSEHSALFFLQPIQHIEELVLSASGGAFRDWSREDMQNITLEDALKHPTWSMGKKITIDSSTLANKGLEVIEAHYLFQKPADKIKVVIHRESTIHSMVRTTDGALYAQISKPDMRLPLQNALYYPDMYPVDSIYIEPWDLNMSFEKVDYHRFPMLPLAYDSIRKGQWATIAYNSANEIAVEAFMKGMIPFTDIAAITEYVLSLSGPNSFSSISDILKWDKEVKNNSRFYLENQHGNC